MLSPVIVHAEPPVQLQLVARAVPVVQLQEPAGVHSWTFASLLQPATHASRTTDAPSSELSIAVALNGIPSS